MEIAAIDIHVHPKTEEFIRSGGRRAQQMEAYFGHDSGAVSFDELAAQYRGRSILACLMNMRDVQGAEQTSVPNERIAEAVRDHPDVFIGFGAIDPHQVEASLEEIDKIAELGLRGIGELNPGRQMFFANDERFYPLWERAAARGLVVLFHTGMLGAGAGTPGGMGYKLKYTRPIPALDDLAADFPTLQIIGAHPSWPYQAESLAIARHKANFWIDLSGWAPKYFSSELVQYANTIIQDKVLFGSDWPVLTPDRWLSEFAQLPLKEEVRRKILRDNAMRLLGLPQAAKA